MQKDLGREHGESYLRIADDGDGIPRDDEGDEDDDGAWPVEEAPRH